jgi:hypothetical protein
LGSQSLPGSQGEFCNQIIHSFNWTVVCREDGGLGGVFFSSDRARRKVLYFADIDLIVVLLRGVGYDDVVSMSMTREQNGDWKVTSLLGADTRTARHEWLMTGHRHSSQPPVQQQSAATASPSIDRDCPA